MKQEVKDRLKKCSKIAIVIGSVLLWLVSFIGISAYSVYWLRQNAAYEQENTQRVLKPKNAINNNALNSYVLRSQSYLSTLIDTQSSGLGTNNYREYFTTGYPQGSDVTTSVNVWFDGDFAGRINATNVYFNRCRIRFSYLGAQDHPDYTLGLDNIIFYGTNGTNYTFYDSTHYVTDVVSFSRITSVSGVGNHIVERYLGGVFDYCFECIFDTSQNYFSYAFESGVRNVPNYLSSYNRLQYGQIIMPDGLDTWGLTIPFTFQCNGELFDSITLLYSPSFFYYNSGGQLVNNIDIFYGVPGTQSFPHICHYVIYGYYGKTLDFDYDELGLLTNVDNGVLAMYMPYSELKTSTIGQDSITAPVYLLTQGLQVNTSYSTIYVTNPDYVPFPNNTGSNMKPYNNLSIRNILSSYFNYYGDVNGYNGSDYDVGVGNVFILISDAFTSLIPLLSIQIIPGITLGLLVLLPLVVTIIVVIIRLVKK